MPTLSTCIWCNKTKLLLNKTTVQYTYFNIGELNKGEKEEHITLLKKWNPRISYSTLIINYDKCIIGFKEDEIRETLSI